MRKQQKPRPFLSGAIGEIVAKEIKGRQRNPIELFTGYFPASTGGKIAQKGPTYD